MNMESLWDKTCALLSQDMPFVSYSTWIDGNMIPGLLENDTLYITVKMDRMISMIQNKYKDLIEKRLSENAGMPMKIVLLSRDEMQKRERALLRLIRKVRVRRAVRADDDAYKQAEHHRPVVHDHQPSGDQTGAEHHRSD